MNDNVDITKLNQDTLHQTRQMITQPVKKVRHYPNEKSSERFNWESDF